MIYKYGIISTIVALSCEAKQLVGCQANEHPSSFLQLWKVLKITVRPVSLFQDGVARAKKMVGGWGDDSRRWVEVN